MNPKLIIALCVFTIIVALETFAAIRGWRTKLRASRFLLGLAVLQVALPTILIILGYSFPPPASGDALNIGVYFGILIIFVPWIELLLLVTGLIAVNTILVSHSKNCEELKQKETQPNLGAYLRARGGHSDAQD